jgi:peroxiredoxin
MLEVFLVVARVLLAAVFVAAGLTKLADRRGSRRAIVDFGVPTMLAPAFAVALPLLELGIGIALLPTGSARWGAIGALGLLSVFIIGIGINLARGRKPDCHCFGQIHSTPVGWPTLIRNGFLAATAGFVIWQGGDDPGPSLIAGVATLTTAQLAALGGGLLLLAIAGIEGVGLVHVLRQNGRLLLRLEALEAHLGIAGLAAESESVDEVASEPGLPVGFVAPDFSLPGLHGETLTLAFLRSAQTPVMLVFAKPGCGPCEALLPELQGWHRDDGSNLRVALVSEGTLEANRTKFGEWGLPFVMVQHDREIAEAYEVSGTPSAVIVRSDGTVGSELAAGAVQIRALVTKFTGEAPVRTPASAEAAYAGNGSGGNGSKDAAAMVQAAAPTVGLGQRAPAITLPDLQGQTFDIGDLRGSQTLLLFWNPGCGFCQRMQDDLKDWEGNRAKKAPQLVVISTGGVEANRGLGLRSRVLLDDRFTVASRFGANGTPMAVLLDTDGKVASEVAAGADAVMALARSAEARA